MARSDVARIYKGSGWQGWGHFLGTGNQRSKVFLPFVEALALARDLKLANQNAWKTWGKDVRLASRSIPTDGGLFDFTRSAARTPHGGVHVDELAKSRKIPTRKYYGSIREQGLRPGNIPAAPNVVYKGSGWQVRSFVWEGETWEYEGGEGRACETWYQEG